MIIQLDLDNTICTEEPTFERCLAKPLEGARETLEWLHSQGETIAIYTARGLPELRMTQEWLRQNHIPYDYLQLGKPVADVIVDDRAIKFLSWDEIPDRLRFPDEDDYLLHVLRRGTKEYIEWIAKQDLMEPIVEVGPMHPLSPVFQKHPDTYVDTRALFAGKNYRSMDIDPSGRPDIVGDFLKSVEILGNQSVGTLILCSVLEHMAFWHAPAVVATIVKPGGRMYACTPWNCRLHGPRPLTGYLSDDGYEMLFTDGWLGDFLEVESIEKIETPNRPLHPVGFKAIVRRKCS